MCKSVRAKFTHKKNVTTHGRALSSMKHTRGRRIKPWSGIFYHQSVALRKSTSTYEILKRNITHDDCCIAYLYAMRLIYTTWKCSRTIFADTILIQRCVASLSRRVLVWVRIFFCSTHCTQFVEIVTVRCTPAPKRQDDTTRTKSLLHAMIACSCMLYMYTVCSSLALAAEVLELRAM